MAASAQVKEIMAELAALEDPAMRAANEARGDDIGVNLSRLRDIAKRLKTQHDYPASPGCTPPYAPVWIDEMVRRREV